MNALTTRQQQQLMLSLYKTNFMMKQMVRMTVNPIVGQSGFRMTADPNTPTIQRILDTYCQFNRLDSQHEQREITRSYINTGEMCFLIAPMHDTWYTQRLPATLIRQTLVDPMNPFEVIGVVLEPEYFYNVQYIYKTLNVNEKRLSHEAMRLRQQWPYSCLYFANNEDDDIEEALDWEVSWQYGKQMPYDVQEWLKKQRRGSPFFITSSDVVNQLIDILWNLLDKVKSQTVFNWDFTIVTNDPDFDSSVAKVQTWQTAIGQPEANTAIYHDETVQVKPVTAAADSGNFRQFWDMFQEAASLAGNIMPFDLGRGGDVNLATAKAQGGPTVEFRTAIQGDQEQMLLAHAQYVITQKAAQGAIPSEEWNQVKDDRQYGVTVISPEIGKKEREPAARTLKTYAEALAILQRTGRWTSESISKAGVKLAKELADVELEMISQEEEVLELPEEPPESCVFL
jgi:hypothetical protein